MFEDENDSQSLPAADPAEDHETPGGNPAQEKPETETNDVDTTVETPGGTTVKEQHASSVNRDGEGAPGDISGVSTDVENPRQHSGDISHLTGRNESEQGQ